MLGVAGDPQDDGRARNGEGSWEPGAEVFS